MPVAGFTCSAVLTNYNHAEFLPAALEAILRQTIAFDEIIILDDGSTDNSIAVINGLIASVPQARLVRNPQNIGVIATLNVGLKEAKGEYIFYVAADDTYDSRILAWSEPLIAANPTLAMVSGDSLTWEVETGQKRVFTLPVARNAAVYGKEKLAQLARQRCITFYGGANLIRRDAMVEAGGFLPQLKWNADWFLYLLVASRHGFAAVPDIWVNIRVAGTQYSAAYRQWSKQKEIIAAFIETLMRDYPEDYPFFRNNALLPTYDIQSLWLIAGSRRLRPYLTPLLVWRLLSYKPLRVFNKLVPVRYKAVLRRLFKV